MQTRTPSKKQAPTHRQAQASRSKHGNQDNRADKKSNCCSRNPSGISGGVAYLVYSTVRQLLVVILHHNPGKLLSQQTNNKACLAINQSTSDSKICGLHCLARVTQLRIYACQYIVIGTPSSTSMLQGLQYILTTCVPTQEA